MSPSDILERMPKADGILPAKQARSRATRQRILRVLAKALEDGSIDQLTVADIARKAKSSVGAFYGRFEDKAAALDALYVDRLAALGADMLKINAQARRQRDPRSWIFDLARAASDHAFENQALLARLAGRVIEAAVLSPDIADDIATTLISLKIKPPHFGPPAAKFLIAMIVGMSRDAALFRPELSDAKARKAFVEDIQKAALWYLTAPSA